MATRRYKLGAEFPSEQFVQASVERYFLGAGFSVDVTSQVDCRCTHVERNEQWHIEANGLTSQPGLDFRTCIGQLVQQMGEPDVRYAIALPDIPQYRAQVDLVATWVIDALRIDWLFVKPDGSLRVVAPSAYA